MAEISNNDIYQLLVKMSAQISDMETRFESRFGTLITKHRCP